MFTYRLKEGLLKFKAVLNTNKSFWFNYCHAVSVLNVIQALPSYNNASDDQIPNLNLNTY